MISFNKNDVIFDIETEGYADLAFIKSINPPYPKFVPHAVDCCNLESDEEKNAKIELARKEHESQEEAYWNEKLEKAALNAETGRVITIGYLPVGKSDQSAVLDDSDFDEKRLLTRFWSGYNKIVKNRGHIIGWNSNNFDIPFLIKRSWIQDVSVPTSVFRGKWISDTCMDLMQVWAVHEFRKFSKLDHCGRVLNLGNKTDQECTGAEFSKWYRDPERREEAIKYGILDLTLTRQIYLKLTASKINTEEDNCER